MTKEEFLLKAREKHGWKYDYSLVNFKTLNDKVAIICPEHGVFYKSVLKHIYSGQGCPECSGKKHYTTEEFIEKVKKLPGTENFSFKNTVYVNNKTKVKIFCHETGKTGTEHGEFEITPLHLLSGEGCPVCRYIKSAKGRRRSLDEIISEAQKVHGDKYDYSSITEYKNDRIKYPIICPEHGVFYQTFNNHIKGKQGCPKCGRKKCDEERRMSFDEFVERASLVHDNRYTYLREGYTNSTDYVSIVCPKHGAFKQSGSNHLHLGHGCPKCGHLVSNAEIELYEFVCRLLGKDKVKHQVTGIIDGKLELDIYIPDKNFAIEYNGLYWHSEVSKEKNYHLNKTIQCNEKGIRLFHIFEDEWLYKKDIVKSMLKSILLGENDRIFARKCEIREVNTQEAKEFLNKNHLQGYCVSKVRYGLYHDNELVSLMTFGKSRHFVGNGKNEWELLRFASKINTSVVGGASKLFKHFIKVFNPENVISYADRRWSRGEVYDILGFTKYNESKPNYYYIIDDKRIYRFNLRKSVLIEKYGCPKDMTEKEFCLQKKWYRIYDCGCLCYIWKKEN